MYVAIVTNGDHILQITWFCWMDDYFFKFGRDNFLIHSGKIIEI